MNLGELMQPLMDWATRLMPQGRRAAEDLYGMKGLCYSATCDNKNIGTPDNIGYCFTSAAAWLAQILWMHYEYSPDEAFLRDGLYPFMKEIAGFYDGFLAEDGSGRLVACPSGSPEMGIAGRDRWSVLSSMSTIDMELIRELYSHVLAAATRLGADGDRLAGWQAVLGKLPLPPITADHGLCEWLEPHEPYDPGHRHRSHFVGIVPGDRITVEDTPDYAAAVRKALDWRHSIGLESSLSLTTVSDAMIYARLYDADEALKQLDATIYYNVMENLLMALYDWRGRGGTLVWFGGHRLFQIEAGLGIAAAIAELVMHDRRGVIRLLPALPGAWPAGEAYGLKARSGFEVSVAWQGGTLKSAGILSTSGGVCRVLAFHAPGGVRVRCGGTEIGTFIEGGIASFETVAGREYQIEPVQWKDGKVTG
jgi:alpha-L-fucosidase 2